MLNRAIQACENCVYKPIDLDFDLLKANGVKVNINDIDLVIEVGKRISGIVELKHYWEASSYNSFMIPFHEYVLYKKVAKSLKAQFFLIVYEPSLKQYYVAEINRFEKDKRPVVWNGTKWASFDRNGFRRLDSAGLSKYWVEVFG
jgi:hypothetical protein